MSTTTLDSREHFKTMSAFMENLVVATKWNLTCTSSLEARGLTSQDSRSMSSASNGSSMSKASVQSTTSSTMYCLPEKKKQRLQRKDKTRKPQPALGDNKITRKNLQVPSLSSPYSICQNMNNTLRFLSEKTKPSTYKSRTSWWRLKQSPLHW